MSSDLVNFFDKFIVPRSVGFDELFSTFDRAFSDQVNKAVPTYPPCNIIRDGAYRIIELALAGWKQDELKITVEGDMLIVTGEKAEQSEDVAQYISRGIAYRSFNRTWVLPKGATIESAKMVDGLLKVSILTAEPAKPKLLTIQIE